MCPAICPSCCAPLFAFSVESDSFLSTLGVVPLACILQPIGPSPPPIFRIDAAIREPTGRASGGRTSRLRKRRGLSGLRSAGCRRGIGVRFHGLTLFPRRSSPGCSASSGSEIRLSRHLNLPVLHVRPLRPDDATQARLNAPIRLQRESERLSYPRSACPLGV